MKAENKGPRVAKQEAGPAVDHGGGPRILAAAGELCKDVYVGRSQEGAMVPFKRLQPVRAECHFARRQPPESVSFGDHLFQFAAQETPRGGCSGRGDRHPSNGDAGLHPGQFFRDGSGLSGFFGQPASAHSGGPGEVYIVLGVLYESYIHPVTILSTLPSAGVGAICWPC